MKINFPSPQLVEYASKKSAIAGEFGEFALGLSRIANSNEISGVWQVRHTRKSGTFQVLSRDTTPSNPRTAKQQANREKFREAIAEARRQGKNKPTSVRNAFVSKYMKTH